MKRRDFILILCAVVGAIVFLSVVSPTVNLQLAAFRFSVQVLPGLGYTRLELPPIGSMEAKTHLGLCNLVLSLQNIDLDSLQQLLNAPGSKEMLITTLLAPKWQLLSQLLLRAAAIAALGGAWGGTLIKRSRQNFIRGSITGIVIALLITLMTVISYEPQALTNPVYSGALRGAPWALGLAQNAWHNWDALGSSVKLFVRNLRQVMAKSTSQLPPEKLDRDLRILHVSDLHNNPLAIDFILEICDNFSPDLIIDTGDLTDFGTPLEETFFKNLALIKVPYYFVLGNHDSPVVAEKVLEIPGITLLDGPEEFSNISILGFRDPASLTGSLEPAASQQVSNQVNVIRFWLQSETNQPFILAVHNPTVAQSFAGEIPLILTGHTHIPSVTIQNGSVLVNAGTTGGAGLRGLLGEKEVPLTAALLYIDISGTTPVVDAIDMISLYPRENRFELTRTAIPQPEETTAEPAI